MLLLSGTMRQFPKVLGNDSINGKLLIKYSVTWYATCFDVRRNITFWLLDHWINHYCCSAIHTPCPCVFCQTGVILDCCAEILCLLATSIPLINH